MHECMRGSNESIIVLYIQKSSLDKNSATLYYRNIPINVVAKNHHQIQNIEGSVFHESSCSISHIHMWVGGRGGRT